MMKDNATRILAAITVVVGIFLFLVCVNDISESMCSVSGCHNVKASRSKLL